MSHAPEGDDLQLADYAGVLRHGWWLIVVFAVLGALGGVGYYAIAHKTYIATASVYVTATSGSANQVSDGRTSGAVNLDTEAQVVRSATVAQAAAKLTHATDSIPELINRVSVTVPANSQVLLISCEAGTARGSATCAQAFAQAYLTYTATSTKATANSQISSLQSKISALESSSAKLSVEVGSLPSNSSQRASAQQQLNSYQSQLDSLNSQVAQLTAELANPSGGSIISNATPPSSPASPRKLLVLPSGLVAGLLIGLVLAFIWDRRDHRIRGLRDLIRINVPVLMAVPAKRSPVEMTIAPPRSQLGRDFAGLAHALTGSLGPGSHVILITGVSPGRGASLVAANLAVSLSRNQPDVVLICADLEGSAIPAMFGLAPDWGLADLLAEDSPVGNVGNRVPIAPRLRVITPGSTALTESEGLPQDAMERLLAGLRAKAPWIVVEAPPVTASLDAYALAQAADAAVLVVEVPRTKDDQVMESVQQLDRIGANVLGAAVLPSPTVSVPQDEGRMAVTSPGVSAAESAIPLTNGTTQSDGATWSDGATQSSRKTRSNGTTQSSRKTQSGRTSQARRKNQNVPSGPAASAVRPPLTDEVQPVDEPGQALESSGEPTVAIDWSDVAANEEPSSARRG